MFVCAGNGEEFEFAHNIGVGLVESAIKLTRLCSNRDWSDGEGIIFVGSAGSYDPKIKLLECYTSLHAFQIESSFLLTQSYSPISLDISSLENVPCETIKSLLALGLPQAIVNSSNYITTNLKHAEAMCEKGILLENMEFFSVLSVARAFGLPALGLFCVSNYCSPQANAEFMQNRNEVKGRISEAVKKIEVFALDAR